MSELNPDYTRAEIFIMIIFGIFIALILFAIYSHYSECVESGGDFVRGVFWFKCINGG